MSGGVNEYTMANIVSNDGATMLSGGSSSSNSGYTGKIYDSGSYTSYTGIDYPNNKYYDKYSFSTIPSTRKRNKLGDSIKEVFNTLSSGWYSDYSRLAYSTSSWFVRGGYYGIGSNAGVFDSASNYGDVRSDHSSRLVITP